MTDGVLILPDADHPQTLQIHGRTVHSRQPEKEAKRQAEELLQHNPECIILLGPGLGFIIEPLLQSSATIVWIEEIAEVKRAALIRLAATLKTFDRSEDQDCIRFADQNGKLRLLLFSRTPDIDELRSILPFVLDRLRYFTLRPTMQAEYAKLSVEIDQRLFRDSVNRNTLRRFDRLWVKNLYHNLRFSSLFRPILPLFGQHRNQPAVVVSAGPSLDDLVPLLGRYRKRFILIAVDTAISTLSHAGIDPDYLISVDAQAANFLHIRSYTGRATLIVDSTVSYLTLRHLKGPFHIFYNPLPAAASILKQLFPDGVGDLLFGGSVSTNAFDLARRLGCSPIYLCGLDLSFVGNRIHARGSALEEAIHARTHRLSLPQQLNHAQLTAIDRRYIPDARGKFVPTNDKLLIFYEWYRSEFERHRRTAETAPLYLIDGGGAFFHEVESILPVQFEQMLQEMPAMQERAPVSGVTPAAVTPIQDALMDGLQKVAVLLRGENLRRGTMKEESSQELAAQLLAADRDNPIPVLRLLSSGMQSRLLDSMDHHSTDQLTSFFADLRDSCSLHLRLLQRTTSTQAGRTD